jgi:D-glycero-alpha-D-manno-heptose 1-phosphate guanylyltransferase
MKNKRITEAIILAGGFGTRLKHIVSDVPKPMAPINGIPFLSFLFHKLIAAGIEHVILSTGYLHEVIESCYGNVFETLRISYSTEEEPLGTGGAILLGMSKVCMDNVLVLNGDTLFEIDFAKLMDYHLQKGSLLTIALREENEVSRYGSVLVDDEGKITSFAEKNKVHGKGLINGGIYLINTKLFLKISLPTKFSFEKDVLEKFYDQINFYGLAFNSYFIDIGIPEDYARAQREFLQLKY